MILVLFSLILISYLWLKRKMLLVFHFDFPANIWFPKLPKLNCIFVFQNFRVGFFQYMFAFQNEVIWFLKCHFWFPKFVAFDLWNGTLISETCLVWFLNWHFWFPQFVAFDFSNGVFYFQNETDMDLIPVTVSMGRGNGHNDQTRQRRCFSEKWECAAG